MTLEYIKRYIRTGMYLEARRLIEKEDDIFSLMRDYEPNHNDYEFDHSSKNIDGLPLLVMLSIIKDEENALNLTRILLEKGYHLDLCDKNGLCALNYAIALKRVKLVSLLLDAFDFELNTFRDCYKNSFLHYAFATNSEEIIQKFSDVYSKYYEWNPENFKNISNCDGLSVKDLYDYSQHFKKDNSKRFRKLSRPTVTTSSLGYSVPECFNLESNPIVICKYINQVYNSNSTMKSELIFVTNSNNLSKQNVLSSNQANREFKLNIMYQIKSLNKNSQKLKSNFNYHDAVKNDYNRNFNISPIYYNDHMPKLLGSEQDELSIKAYKSSSPSQVSNSSNWRSDFKQMFVDYSIINSSSYRIPSATPKTSGNDSGSQNFLTIIQESLNSTNKQNSHALSRGSSASSQSYSNHSSSIHNDQSHSKSKPHVHAPKLNVYLVPGTSNKSKK